MWPTQPIPSSASGLSSLAKDSSKQALARSQSPSRKAAQPASSGDGLVRVSATIAPSSRQAREASSGPKSASSTARSGRPSVGQLVFLRRYRDEKEPTLKNFAEVVRELEQ